MRAIYHVQLKVENGGATPVFNTTDRSRAAGFCKNQNMFYEKVGSPNRYFFEVTDESGQYIEDPYKK